MAEITVAIIGAGARGKVVYENSIKDLKNVKVVAICDVNKQRCEELAKRVEECNQIVPSVYEDYKACLDETKPQSVVISTAWEKHLEITEYAMERGIAVACEVGGAYSIESLWKLVRCYEKTKTPVMMMENCCYGQIELLALNMKRRGLLGKIVHCEGAYRHDLRDELTRDASYAYYRLYEYIARNCENYPTHEIGPIAKLLDINCGNRFTSLFSVGSGSHGLKEFVEEKNRGFLKGVEFAQSDIITTLIKCAGGETVTITLDTTLPRYYSRGFQVNGTKGMLCEENRSVYLDKDFAETDHWKWKEHFNNIDEYFDKYNHRLWKDYHPGEAGHGGMDALVYGAFFDALEKGLPMPIDVYDMATWMSISVLSEQSIATGNAVAFPDFTDGKWVTRKNNFEL